MRFPVSDIEEHMTDVVMTTDLWGTPLPRTRNWINRNSPRDEVGGAREEVVIASAYFTVYPEDSGKTYVINAQNVIAQLPTADKGLTYTFWVKVPSTANGFQLSPGANDAIQMKGISSGDNKNLINTAATDAEGDFVQVVADGAAGWIVVDSAGTWARET